MRKTKPATRNVTKIEREKFERMFVLKHPLLDLVYDAMWSFRYRYHLDENAEVYKVQWNPRGRLPTRILEVGLLKEYREGGVLESLRIEDNYRGGNVGFAMIFEQPKRGEKVSEIKLGIGINKKEGVNGLFDDSWTLFTPSRIKIRVSDGKPTTDIYTRNAANHSMMEYSLIGISQDLYDALSSVTSRVSKIQ